MDETALSYQEARRKATILWWAGIATFIPLMTSCAISVMLMMYHRIDDGSVIGAAIARPFKTLVYNIFDNTRYLEFFWTYSPVPNPFQVKDQQNLYFALTYIGLLTSVWMIRAAIDLSRRLRAVNQFRTQNYAESYEAERTRPLKEVGATVGKKIKKIWPSLYENYVRHIIVGVIVALIVRLFGD